MLPTLDAESVQCVVTSPPYFGLRDYGTASWEGGDPACQHSSAMGAVVGNNMNVRGANETEMSVGGWDKAERDGNQRRTVPAGGQCDKCGARRIDQQIGLEPTVEAYVAEMVAVFREVRRVLRDDGVLFLNLGDSYANDGKWGGATGGKHAEGLHGGTGVGRQKVATGLKPKDLIGIPWRVAFALQSDGWWLRSDIVWSKSNPMPESVTDRPTKAHEYIFLLTKSARYFWDAEAVKEEGAGRLDRSPGSNGRIGTQGWKSEPLEQPAGRNLRSVWTIATAPFAEAHFATFPPALAERCIKAGTSEKGACPACGAPWARVVERGELVKSGHTASDSPPKYDAERDGYDRGRNFFADGVKPGMAYERTTTGWQPSCACDAGDPVPCVVLDPFAGAGTVALVADRLGRHSIGIELNPEYIAMARQRVTNDAPLLVQMIP